VKGVLQGLGGPTGQVRDYNGGMLLQPHTPVVMQVVDAPTPEANVGEILLGAVGLVGAVLLAAAVAGLIVGGLAILYRAWRSRRAPDDHDQYRLTPYTP